MYVKVRIAALFCLLFVLGGCGVVTAHHAVPENAIQRAVVEGYPAGIRYIGDEAPDNLAFIIERRISQYKAANEEYFKAHGAYPPMSYLAVSGGGDNGAFGAGLLHGWSTGGTRPQFTIVTGVSTGALIAPFAFLGPEYDDELKQFYTTLSTKNLFTAAFSTVWEGLTGGMSLVDNTPLARMIEQKITPEIFARIAAEHRRGRRLLIGTTNLETQRSIIWDIGTLANSGNPDALHLFHKIMLASTSIPGAFKPVFIDVTVDGRRYNEIHVDGGVTAQVFLYPLQSAVNEKQIFDGHGISRRLYILRNAKLTPEYASIKPNLIYLSQRSIETLIKNQGIGDLFKLYAGARRDGVEYNLINIPQGFNVKPKELFDREYMSQLFALGDTMGRTGIPWMQAPPNLAYQLQPAAGVSAPVRQ
jgi:predicted patatin/cPLA2 family phospholipase